MSNINNNILSHSIDTVLQPVRGCDYKERIAFLNALAFIEKGLYYLYDIDVGKPITIDNYYVLCNDFERLKEFSLNEVNTIMFTLMYFRNACAHFVVSHAKFPSAVFDILNRIRVDYNMLYPTITCDGEVTIYGMLTLLALFSDVLTLHKLLSNISSKYFEKETLFSDIDRLQKNLTAIGLCKHQVYPFESNNDPKLNKILYDYLTAFFLALEEALCRKVQKRNYDDVNLYNLLKQDNILSLYSEQFNALVVMRNYWFHGCYLGETIRYSKSYKTFSLLFVVRTLSTWYKILQRVPTVRFNPVVGIINDFAKALIACKYKKLIQLSLELFAIPSILPYNVQKITHELNEEYIRMHGDPNISNEVITLAYKMTGRVGLSIYVNGYELSDKVPRTHKGRYVKIIHIKSANNLTVRGTIVEDQELYFVLPHNCVYYGSINNIDTNKIKFQNENKVNIIEQIQEIKV